MALRFTHIRSAEPSAECLIPALPQDLVPNAAQRMKVFSGLAGCGLMGPPS